MTVRRFETDERDPFRRGVALGAGTADGIRENARLYRELFAAVGVDTARLREYGESAVAAIDTWSPTLGVELRGMAEGSGVAVDELGMLNARTEILATAAAVGAGECSTVVALPAAGAPRSVQTWDWHDTANPDTLVVRAPSATGGVRYFTEFGLLGKIGVNEAGLGLHFNILSHRADGERIGVPVHAVAREVLDRAGTIAEAIEIARAAPVTASTVLTVIAVEGGRPRAVCIELSAGGTAVVEPADDLLVHTNHFLDPGLAAGEQMPADSGSYSRLAMLRGRPEGLDSVAARDRAAALAIHQVDGAPVCSHADPTLAAELRWQSLLTISIDVVARRLEFHDGTPCTVDQATWQVF